MKFTHIEEVEGQIILGFSVFDFHVAKGIASHDILFNLLYVSIPLVLGAGGVGRERK